MTAGATWSWTSPTNIWRQRSVSRRIGLVGGSFRLGNPSGIPVAEYDNIGHPLGRRTVQQQWEMIL